MLYQQGTQRIEVIVKKEADGTGGNGAKETDAENASATGGENTTNSPKKGLTAKQKRIIKTNLTHSLAVTKQVLDLGIEYYIAGIGQRQGDQALQDSVSRRMEVVKDPTNVASSIGMGVLYGSWGGPIGAVLGGVFGAVSTSASLMSKYGGRQRDYDFKIFKQNNAIEYSRARAGINLTNGRLR